MPDNINPFIYGRREFETDTPIYVDDTSEGFLGFFDWISGQQFLFEGIRGSGKSSILRSMEWDVAWKISPIQVKGSKAIEEFFNKQPKHFGIRYRVEEMDSRYWDWWKNRVGKECAQIYFGTYFEYLLVDLFLNALIDLMHRYPEYFTKPDAEYALLDVILREGFPDPKSRPRLAESSLRALRNIIWDQHSGIKQAVYRGVSGVAISEEYVPLSPGSLVRCFGKNLVKNYDVFADSKVFPMLDDCNHLYSWQAEVLNAAISRAEAPVYYKITSVIDLYKSQQTTDGRPLNENELKAIRISGEDEAEWHYLKRFSRVAQGVCQTRIRKHYSDEYANRFDFRRVLGKFDIETLLEHTVRESENPKAIGLLTRYKGYISANDKNIKSLTSAWLYENKIREEKTPSFANKDMQEKLLARLDSTYWRKWRYSAAIAICNELKLSFPYYGWQTVIHLSCGSIREMLNIMSEMWNVSDTTIDNFVNKRGIDYRIQRKAVKNAALNHLRGVSKLPICSSKTSLKSETNIEKQAQPEYYFDTVCNRFGQLFKILQSYPSIGVTAETASIKYDCTKLDKSLLDDIDLAIMSGAMMRKEFDNSSLALGLRPILAPIYDISFRRPFFYYETLSETELHKLFTCSDTEVNHLISEIVKRRLGRLDKGKHKSGQLPLLFRKRGHK